MGLDCSHNCWHGPYSQFGRWRKAVCQVAGYGDLDSHEGFKGTTPWPKNGDVLIKLLDHSDCDGAINKEDCGPIANRLTELLPALVNLDYGTETRQFIEGLLVAAANHEAVIFL